MLKEYYEIRIKENNTIIFDSYIYAHNNIEAYEKLKEKMQALYIELEYNQIILIEKIKRD